MKKMNIILVGLGHELHGDDESGLEIARRWAESRAERFPGVETALLDNPGLNLLGQIAGRDAAILVAAVRVGAPPGSVRVFQEGDLEGIAEANWKGGAWGAAETLSLGRQLTPEDLPDRLLLIGVEGAAFGLGEGLSPAVRAAIPQALSVLDAVLVELMWKKEPLRTAARRMISLLRRVFVGPGLV